MKASAQTLEEIRIRLSGLIRQHQLLQAHINTLEVKLKTIEIELTEQKNTNKALAEQNKIAKLAVSLTHDDGADDELRKKLNHYIREVEECIRLVGDSKL